MAGTFTETWRGPVVHWKAVVGAGLIASLVFLMYEMIMVPLFMGQSPWGPPRMMAAILMGEGVLPPPATFNFVIVMVAMMIHFVLGVIYAFIIAEVVHRTELGIALVIGALAGLTLYFINFYGFTAVFPWFEMARNWISLSGHVLFGLVTAWTYRSMIKDKAP